MGSSSIAEWNSGYLAARQKSNAATTIGRARCVIDREHFWWQRRMRERKRKRLIKTECLVRFHGGCPPLLLSVGVDPPSFSDGHSNVLSSSSPAATDRPAHWTFVGPLRRGWVKPWRPRRRAWINRRPHLSMSAQVIPKKMSQTANYKHTHWRPGSFLGCSYRIRT